MKDCYLDVDTKDGDDYNRGGIRALMDAKCIFEGMVANLKVDQSYEETEDEEDIQ
jgi:hypothetical protein